MHVADRLQRSMELTGSIACVGLDPRVELVPPSLRNWGLALAGSAAEQVGAVFARYNREIIDAIDGACAAVKPQVACYEAFGVAGWQCLEDTIRYARSKGIEVVLDAKRGDIGSTATHYREGLLDGARGLSGQAIPGLGADWLTVSPYLGNDSVLPLLGDVGQHGLFLLVKTSNPGGSDLQDVHVGSGGAVSSRVAELVDSWGSSRLSAGGLSDIGAVVGATWPQDAITLRSVMPHSLFLVPGYGAQGGSAAGAVAGMRPDGSGILVSSSRGITGAWQSNPDAESDFADIARTALDEMNTALAGAR